MSKELIPKINGQLPPTKGFASSEPWETTHREQMTGNGESRLKSQRWESASPRYKELRMRPRMRERTEFRLSGKQL